MLAWNMALKIILRRLDGEITDMDIMNVLVRNRDITAGLLVALATAMVSAFIGIYYLSLGALVAAFVYCVKLYDREKGL